MIDDGGPAFPLADAEMGGPGMSLLEWYAGQALPIVMQAKPPATTITTATAAELTAKISFEFAQAMIAERKRIIEKSA